MKKYGGNEGIYVPLYIGHGTCRRARGSTIYRFRGRRKDIKDVNMKEIWRNYEEGISRKCERSIWTNMTLTRPKRDASGEDRGRKFRPIIGLRGTWKISSSTPGPLSSSFWVQTLKKHEGKNPPKRNSKRSEVWVVNRGVGLRIIRSPAGLPQLLIPEQEPRNVCLLSSTVLY